MVVSVEVEETTMATTPGGAEEVEVGVGEEGEEEELGLGSGKRRGVVVRWC